MSLSNRNEKKKKKNADTSCRILALALTYLTDVLEL